MCKVYIIGQEKVRYLARSTGEQIQTHRELLLAVISTKRKLDKTPDLGILVHKESRPIYQLYRLGYSF